MAAETLVQEAPSLKGNTFIREGSINTAGITNATGTFVPIGIAAEDMDFEGGLMSQLVIGATASGTLTLGYAAIGKAQLTEVTLLSAALPLTTAGGGAVDVLVPFVPVATGGNVSLIPAGARYGFLTNKTIADTVMISYNLKFRKRPS